MRHSPPENQHFKRQIPSNSLTIIRFNLFKAWEFFGVCLFCFVLFLFFSFVFVFVFSPNLWQVGNGGGGSGGSDDVVVVVVAVYFSSKRKHVL